jgi:hypothetical protein
MLYAFVATDNGQLTKDPPSFFRLLPFNLRLAVSPRRRVVQLSTYCLLFAADCLLALRFTLCVLNFLAPVIQALSHGCLKPLICWLIKP